MVKRYFILVVSVAFLLFSCENDEPSFVVGSGFTNNETNNKYVNKWIYEEMSFCYLWNTNIPGNPDYELHPEKFFESLLYDREKVTGDRFSWIQENYVELLDRLSGVTLYDIGFGGIILNDIGFEYVGYRLGSTEVIGQIAYVKPNTDAEMIGLKRGDLFTKVNGTTLNTTNWRDLLSGSETSVTITFVDENTGVTTNKTVKKEANYAEDPVFFDKVYEVNGHKIGYLVYNFFESGTINDNHIYEKKLNDVFGRFNSAGITELVLDLRYNSGGLMSTATLLGSMIVPDLNTNNIFIKKEYNSLFQAALVNEYGKDALVDRLKDKLETGEAINNAGNTIQSLYVLTSSRTASASELIINNLKPYMPIVLIGTTTMGKNVGSVLIYKENDSKNKWGIMPVILRYFNRDGSSDFLNGFAPDIVELDNSNKLPLGDPNERMLKIAIDHITGNYVPVPSSRSGVSERIMVGSSIEQRAWAGKTIVDDSLLKKLNIW